MHLPLAKLTVIVTATLPKVIFATEPTTCEAAQVPKLFNSAFVFVKPHACTPQTRTLVEEKLLNAGIDIVCQAEINGTEIDAKGLIDQHYYSIAAKATLLPTKEIPVPVDRFEQAFGESWESVLMENRACNALEACHRFQCTPLELNEAWQKVKSVKFGGGFYCGR